MTPAETDLVVDPATMNLAAASSTTASGAQNATRNLLSWTWIGPALFLGHLLAVAAAGRLTSLTVLVDGGFLLFVLASQLTRQMPGGHVDGSFRRAVQVVQLR